MSFESNTIFETAWQLVNYSGRNIFLTGKAGTGKTTFLKKLIKETNKKCVVVAPTGVAAINAGGVTMHSFFQLPFQPFIKNGDHSYGEIQFANRYSLLKNLRINREKSELINELELLVIDEVSMLRADMLDAIDETLRYTRENRKQPFGGVQVLFIGDLFQLPPVVVENEIRLLHEYYESPFFFSAEVLKQNPPLIVELKNIYRQRDEKFIHLLNNIRHNCLTEHDFELLESRYSREFQHSDENSIILTTHNNTADKVNETELKKLDSPLFKFHADIDGDFNEKAFPTEKILELKMNAQIMFIKNDSSGKGKYYNGKLATIIKIDKDEIVVRLAETKIEMKIEKETWTNIRYFFNKEENKINEEPLGSFSQYPVRLAWAITIHKSQGLTFTKAAIDAGASFAAGQVYVALSRCTALEGLTLLSRITPESVRTDERIIQFASRETDLNVLNLEEEKFAYSTQRLYKIFDWKNILSKLDEMIEFASAKTFGGKENVIETLKSIRDKASEQNDVVAKFIDRINEIISRRPVDAALIEERVKKAKNYFIEKLHNEIIRSLEKIIAEYKVKPKTKQLIKRLKELDQDLWRKTKEIEKADVSGLDLKINNAFAETHFEKSKKELVEENIPSKKISLDFYKDGKTIEEIGKIRSLSATTIEGHLAEYISTGEVNVLDFITEEQLKRIKNVYKKEGAENLTSLKTIFGDELSYGQLRMAVNFIGRKKE